jgi:hypothetical protein
MDFYREVVFEDPPEVIAFDDFKQNEFNPNNLSFRLKKVVEEIKSMEDMAERLATKVRDLSHGLMAKA